MSRKKIQLNTNSTALICAAFQDKIMRDLNLNKNIGNRNSYSSKRNRLTLAQHLGIEEKPLPMLTKKEWKSVHTKCLNRNDIEFGCAICCEHFKEKSQVLLSCSHTFHKQCIQSFENYSHLRCCPLCRYNDYQKHIIKDGAKC